MRSVLDGRDVLAVMPTGSGKSLGFQPPATVLPGLTLVVSPLIALMKDQVDELNRRGIRAGSDSFVDGSRRAARHVECRARRHPSAAVRRARALSHHHSSSI